MTEENIKPLSCSALARMMGREPTTSERIEDALNNQAVTDILNMHLGLPKNLRDDEKSN